ncbi:hypothetical protein ACSBL2_12890 [Pedobacter sp. AW31-3R]
MKNQSLKLTKKTVFVFKANEMPKGSKMSDPTTTSVKTTGTSTVPIL